MCWLVVPSPSANTRSSDSCLASCLLWQTICFLFRSTPEEKATASSHTPSSSRIFFFFFSHDHTHQITPFPILIQRDPHTSPDLDRLPDPVPIIPPAHTVPGTQPRVRLEELGLRLGVPVAKGRARVEAHVWDEDARYGLAGGQNLDPGALAALVLVVGELAHCRCCCLKEVSKGEGGFRAGEFRCGISLVVWCRWLKILLRCGLNER